MPSEPAKPKRIQRKRTKGWEVPPNTVYVGAPTKPWGNPIPVTCLHGRIGAKQQYRQLIESDPELVKRARAELRGKDLACRCALDQPCHADILLEVANAE